MPGEFEMIFESFMNFQVSVLANYVCIGPNFNIGSFVVRLKTDGLFVLLRLLVELDLW